MAATMLSRRRPQPLPAMARSKSLCFQQSQSLQESRWRFRSFPYKSGEADYSPDYAREVADYRADSEKAAFPARMKRLDSLNTEENPSRLPLRRKGFGDDNSTYYKEHNQTTGSDDYNPSESLLPIDSPHAYTDYDERGNVATGSDDSNRSESLLPSVSSHANTDYGEQGNVANVVSQGSDDSNLSESLLPSVRPQANTDFGEPGNQATTVGSDDSNRSGSLLPSVSSHANTNYGEQGNVANVLGSDDSNLSESLLPSVHPQANTDFGEPGNQTTTVDRSSSDVVIGVADENNNFNHPRYGTRVTRSLCIFILTGLSLEMLSASFDQLSSPNKPHYALVSLLLAIAAVLTCILELIHNGIKEGVESTNGMVSGILPDIFGLGLSVIQCLCSAEQFYFVHQHEKNPMKFSPVPFFVFFCLVVWKLKMNWSYTVIRNANPVTVDNMAN